MLTGRVPFTAPAPVDVILKHLHDAPVPPRELRPDVAIAPELEQIVLRCMAKGREERFQSMDELMVQLKAVRALLTGSSGPQPVAPHHDTQPIRSAPLPAIAQTPPTPQPGTRTPSQPMSAMRATPSRGTAHVSRPPPPPLEAILEEEEEDWSWASRRRAIEEWIRREWAAKRRAAQRWVEENWETLRIALPPALILVAGIGTAAIVVRAPVAAPEEPAPATAVASPEVPPPATDVASSEVPRPATDVASSDVPRRTADPALAPPAAAPAAPREMQPVAPLVPAAQGQPVAFTLLTLTSNPSGAEVRDADDRFLGTTPFDLRVPSNEPLQLTLRHHGYRAAPIKRVVQGERMSLNVTMKSAKADPYETRPSRRSVGYKDDPY
jgi:hypothetical protein